MQKTQAIQPWWSRRTYQKISLVDAVEYEIAPWRKYSTANTQREGRSYRLVQGLFLVT